MKTLLVAGFAIVFALSAPASSAQSACKSTVPPDCAVYNKCIAANCKCTNYPATFGPKYCQRFKKEKGFSETGRRWRDKTLLCLASKASEAYAAQNPPGCNCDNLQHAMITSHTPCYTSDPSFCDLPDSDVKVVARIVDAHDMLSLGEDGITEIGHTLIACYKTRKLDRTVHLASVFFTETIAEGKEESRKLARMQLDSAADLAQRNGFRDLSTRLRELRQKLLPDVTPMP